MIKTKLIVFGITGDLGRGKLLPALEEIVNARHFDDLTIIGISRRPIEKYELINSCRIGSVFCERISLYSMDTDNIDAYFGLKQYVNLQSDEQLLIYLAVPPLAASGIVEKLGITGMNGENVKLLFEKPFGVDLDSAKQVIQYVNNYYKEDQIYRIDHYLAKEMAQNIVAFRSKNALFNNIWNNNFIESIQIIASEDKDIQGRVQLYEQTGALRDVLQGHLMQLVALTIMDIPVNFEWSMLPELRLKALAGIQTANPDLALRAQYEGYTQEVANSDSKIETFALLKLYSGEEKWAGVPITIMAGKAMNRKLTEIRVKLRGSGSASGNDLVFRIQPNEGIDIGLFTKKPGYNLEFEEQSLSFNYPDNVDLPDAYEQVLVDAISSQKSLFTSSDEVLRSWEILAPIQERWSNHESPLSKYPKGSDIHSI